MSSLLSLKKIDEVYFRVDAEPHIIRELYDRFTFVVPNAKFMPQYKAGLWDGKLHLFSYRDNTIYAGLISHIKDFCDEYEYELVDHSEVGDFEFSVHEAEEFIKSLELPDQYKPRDYQIDAFISAVRKRRMLLLSPTGSGKSLIIYLLTRYYLENQEKKILIIVPSTSLIVQLSKDFIDYGFNSRHIHRIMAGQSKTTNRPVVVSTWQSLFRLSKNFFDDYGMVVVDECHGVKAKSLTGIMTKTPNIKYRFGTTATLDGTLTNKLVIEGLLGKVHKVTETKKLIDEKILSDFLVKAIILKHETSIKANTKYQDEIDYLITSTERNNFIKNLALSLDGNTLVLFNYVEKHGVPLFNLIKGTDNNRKVFFVHGGTDLGTREEVRNLVEQETNAIIVASSGVFSQGINIKRLNNIIFTHPGKSRIRTLQSIGRTLRKIDDNEAILYDIVDDLSGGRKYVNFAIKHYQERFTIYKSEKFKVKSYNVELKKGTV